MQFIIIAYGPSMVMTSTSGPRDRIATRSCLDADSFLILPPLGSLNP